MQKIKIIRDKLWEMCYTKHNIHILFLLLPVRRVSCRIRAKNHWQKARKWC